MKKILCVVCLIFSSSLWSQENFGLDEYKEFLKENYKNLSNYQMGTVFLNIDYMDERFSENLDSNSLCHTNSFVKETLIDGNRDQGKYYVLEEKWSETHCIDQDQDKVSGITKEIIQKDWILPTLDMYLGAQDNKNVSVRRVDNFALEANYFEYDEKYIFDYSRPLKYIQKEKIREGKIIEEIRQLPAISLAELLPKLNGIPVYLQFLNQWGITRKVKVSDTFLEFWVDSAMFEK